MSRLTISCSGILIGENNVVISMLHKSSGLLMKKLKDSDNTFEENLFLKDKSQKHVIKC